VAPGLRALVNSGHGEDLIVRPRKRRVAPLLAGFVAELVPTVRGGRSRRSGGAHPARQGRVGAGVQGPMKPIIDRLPRIGISAPWQRAPERQMRALILAGDWVLGAVPLAAIRC
jgi:hypothetical protein